MSKLQALMEAQRKAKEQANVERETGSSDSNRPEPTVTGKPESAGESNGLQLPSVPAESSGAGGFKPRFTPAGNPSGANGFKPKPSVSAVVDSGTNVDGITGLPARAATRVASRDASRNVLSLDDIDSLALDEELDSPSGIAGFLYIDREKVVAPDREYEFELDESQAGFVGLLDGIYEVLNDAQAFGAMIRTIMLELQENGEYRRLLADSDVNAMMRGLRDSMGMARIKKTEKTKGRSSAPASKRQNQVLESLDGLGFDASDLDD